MVIENMLILTFTAALKTNNKLFTGGEGATEVIKFAIRARPFSER